MQILIKSSVLDDIPIILNDKFECIVNQSINEIGFDIYPSEECDVHERYIIQYDESDTNDDYVQLFTNGFDDDKLLELMRCIKHYHPQFEWIENEK